MIKTVTQWLHIEMLAQHETLTQYFEYCFAEIEASKEHSWRSAFLIKQEFLQYPYNHISLFHLNKVNPLDTH